MIIAFFLRVGHWSLPDAVSPILVANNLYRPLVQRKNGLVKKRTTWAYLALTVMIF
ncbi:hypothetical protein FRC10_002732, partial [Ceratobasidium sp. 414]